MVERLAIVIVITALLAVGGTLQAQTSSVSATMITTVNRVLESQKTGVPSSWSIPEAGLSGSITVTRTYYRGDGTPCREYIRTIDSRGSTRTIRGTGCRIAAEVWTLTEAPPAADEPPASAVSEAAPPSPEAAARRAAATPPFVPAPPARKPTLIAGVMPTPSVD